MNLNFLKKCACLFQCRNGHGQKTRSIIINCFPQSLRSDVEKVIDVIPSNKNILLANGKIHKSNNLIHDNLQKFLLNDEILNIPSRVYFNEPAEIDEKALTERQQLILNCIYLRHHNGFIRQKRVDKIIGSKEDFVIPFIIQLLGEYVVEILYVLDQNIKDEDIKFYKNFILQNEKYWQKTKSRLISYWNEYYRSQYPILKEYVGFKIIQKLELPF